MLMKQRQVACALFVCVIRFAQSGPATRRRCRRRLNNRLSRLRNQRHARKEGRNRISSWFMRPPRRPSLYSPTLRFRAFIRRRLPPASFLRSFSRSLPLRPAFRPSVRPSVRCAHYRARFAFTSCLRTLNYGQTTRHASSVCPPDGRPNIEWFPFTV